MPSPDKPYSYRWPVLASLVLIGVYGLYVFEQFRDLHDLNQRELAMAAQELKKTVENANGTVERFLAEFLGKADFKQNLATFDDDQPYLTLAPPLDQKGEEAKPGEKAPHTIGVRGGSLEIGVGSQPRFKVSVGSILQEMAFPDSFRLVFLAHIDGDKAQVIHQEAPGSRRWLRTLRWADRDHQPPNPAASGPLSIRDAKDLIGGKTLSTTRLQADLAGDSYHVYLQPVSFNGSGSFVLGGVVPVRELFLRALRVDTYFAAALLLVLIAGILGIPFLKLWALNRRERFRLRDVHLLYLSSGGLLALVTFSLVGTEGYMKYREVADEGLKKLARDLSCHFVGELQAARRELDVANRMVAEKPDFKNWQPRPNWFTKVPEKEPPKIDPPLRSVHVEQFAWVGSGSKQIWKITADKVAPLRDVADRPYVSALRKRPTNLFSAFGGPNFHAAPNRSITDGKFYTFLSIPSALPDPDGVAVATIKLTSMDRQPLPAGYGFALINREGTVLYHSDTRLSLRENILAELDDSVEFRAHLMSRSVGVVGTSYRERAHRFWIAPLDELSRADREPSGLFVVTFRDTAAEVALFAHVFLLSLGPLAALLVLLACALWAVETVSRGKAVPESCPRADRAGTWLWPQQALLPLYRKFGLVLGGLLAVMLPMCCLGGWAYWLLAPAVVMVAGVALHLRREPNREPRKKLDGPWRNTAQWILIMICVVMLPSAGLFRLVLEHEYGSLIQTEKNWIEEQKTDIGLEARAAASDESYSRAVQDHMAALREQYRLPPPSPFDAKPAQLTGWWKPLIDLVETVGHALPVPNDTVARYRHQEFDVTYAPPGRFCWGWPSLLVWPPFLVLLWAMCKWIRWNARNLFFADLEQGAAPEGTAAPTWAALTAPGDRFLVMQIFEENLANPGQAREVERLIKAGFLRLNPDLQPATAEFCAVVGKKAEDPAFCAELGKWEQVEGAHSWRYMRTVVVAGLAALAAILFQSEITALAGAVAAGLTTLSKLREAIGAWLPSAAKGDGS